MVRGAHHVRVANVFRLVDLLLFFCRSFRGAVTGFPIGDKLCSGQCDLQGYYQQLPTPLESEITSLDSGVLSTAVIYGLVQLGLLSLYTVFEWGDLRVGFLC